MITGQTLLLEIGTEEIPARVLPQAALDLAKLVEQALDAASLAHSTAEAFWTPRRLAVLIRDVPERQPDLEQLILGPSVAQAYDANGNPTRACLGFAKSQGVKPEELIRAQGPKGEVLAVHRKILGRKTTDILVDVLPQALSRLSFPKTMFWNGHQGPFVRPIHWVLCLFGKEEVVFEFAGVRSSRFTRGHRFHAPQPFELTIPESYSQELRNRSVVVSHEERVNIIINEMLSAENALGITFIKDTALLHEVADLVENPVFSVGSYDPSFLELPREVLITAMASHQRYFAAQDASGCLVPKFGVVSNTRAKDMATVVRGNERVLHARLYDARFFYNQDLKTGIQRMANRLKERLFLKGAGHMAEKAERLADLADSLCRLAGLDELRGYARRAALLCKADLMSLMVGEFPELQGVMGRYYAIAAGEPEIVAKAIEEHYLPRTADDRCPSTDLGAILAVADRLDTVISCFKTGVTPSGSKDPLGIRRQAAGLLKILINRGWPKVTMAVLLELCHDTQLRAMVRAFVAERFHGILTDDFGIPTDFATAVLENFEHKTPSQTVAMALALKDFSEKREGFRDFLETVFRRVYNILRQADEKLCGWREQAQDAQFFALSADETLTHPFERAVEEALQQARSALDNAQRTGDYHGLLEALYSFKEPLARFFGTGSEGVPVLIEKNEEKRLRRLSLLVRILDVFGWFADFSKVSSR